MRCGIKSREKKLMDSIRKKILLGQITILMMIIMVMALTILSWVAS